MKKVKIFKNEDPARLEEDINNWLKDNDVMILHINQTSHSYWIGTRYRKKLEVLVITIIYMEKVY